MSCREHNGTQTAIEGHRVGGGLGGVITGEPKRTAAPKPQPRAPSDLRLTADARTQSVD